MITIKQPGVDTKKELENLKKTKVWFSFKAKDAKKFFKELKSV